MSKKLFKCNHCGQSIRWYESALHETGFREIHVPMGIKHIKLTKRYYCEECMRKIALCYLSETHL